MEQFSNFTAMGGYAVYVWPSYGLVLGLLAFQLLKPWRRWQKMTRKAKARS